MTLKPWMIACMGAVITLLALVLQEKLTKCSTSLGQYVKALGFNSLLSYGIAVLLLQTNPLSGKGMGTLSIVTGGNGHASSVLPADILSGPPHF